MFLEHFVCAEHGVCSAHAKCAVQSNCLLPRPDWPSGFYGWYPLQGTRAFFISTCLLKAAFLLPQSLVSVNLESYRLMLLMFWFLTRGLLKDCPVLKGHSGLKNLKNEINRIKAFYQCAWSSRSRDNTGKRKSTLFFCKTLVPVACIPGSSCLEVKPVRCLARRCSHIWFRGCWWGRLLCDWAVGANCHPLQRDSFWVGDAGRSCLNFLCPCAPHPSSMTSFVPVFVFKSCFEYFSLWL